MIAKPDPSAHVHIISEVAAEFENPVMLYSIGKDSSAMVRLAQKAFYPGKLPFSAHAYRFPTEISGNDHLS